MFLDEILQKNREFATGRGSRPLPDPGTIPSAVVGCYDPRLDDLIRPALGLSEGEAILVRTAGALVRPDGDPLRSLSLAVYLFGVRHVLVLGHTSCRMAAFPVAEFIEAFRGRGVDRAAFGLEDLRSWAGAISSPRRGVLESVAAIRATPFLPRDLEVAGLVLDDASGQLELVVRPEEPIQGLVAPAGASAPAHGPAAPGAGEPLEAPSQPPRSGLEATDRRAPDHAEAGGAASRAEQGARAAGASPPRAGAPAATDAERRPHGEAPEEAGGGGGLLAKLVGADLAPLIAAVRRLLRRLESEDRWRDEVRALQRELDRTRNPLVQWRLIEGFLRRATSESGEIAAEFQDIRREFLRQRPGVIGRAFQDLLSRVAGGRP